MKKILLLLFILPLALKAQYLEKQFHNDPAAPGWIRLINADRPNLFSVESTYKAYYESHPFVKNMYTQYYKRWRRWAAERVDGRGFVADGTLKQKDQLTEDILSRRNSTTGLKKGSSNVWRFIGPKETYSDGSGQVKVAWQCNMYGLDQSLSNPDILFASGETGGLYKSVDHGMSWTIVNANVNTGSIRAIKIHPTNPDIVYVGGNSRIYKTTDGGATWLPSFSLNEMWAHDILINPVDPQIVCAATNKGFLRTTDAGATWQTILPKECWTVRFKPGNPNIVYTVSDADNSSEFYKSVDGGATFAIKKAGWYLPTATQSVYGVRIAVTPANPEKIYALIGADGADVNGYIGVFVSTNGGEIWTHPHGAVGPPYVFESHPNLMAHDGVNGFYQGFYDFAIIASPNDADKIIVGGTSWWKSDDGARTYQPLGSYVGGLPWSHPDMQWLHANGNELWICSDGGINYSTDFAKSMETRMSNIAGSDFWGFDAGWNEDVLVGGRYHNGNTAYHENYPAGKYLRMGGAEASTGYVNPAENKRVYFSDLGGRILPDSVNGNPGGFSVGKWPNESYYYAESSEMEFDPRCWNTVYIGNGNTLWKSRDGAASYDSIFASPDNGAVLEHIQIARSNPKVMYVSQRSNTIWDGKIWRSDDEGKSWKETVQIPASSGDVRRVMSMTLSGTNENELWVAPRGGGAGEKVFKTTDGGATWLNLSTPTIANVWINTIQHQYGTDGGVYIATAGGEVFYRNNKMPDWRSMSANLPLGLATRKLRPFYRKGLLRSGSNMGIWETELYEASKPVAQISVDKFSTDCVRDTVYFRDHSVLGEQGATYAWSFPGASYVSSSTAQNPKVLYTIPGVYSVTLKVTNAIGSDTQTLANLIEILPSACSIDSVTDKALDLKDNTNTVELAPIPALAKATSFTFMCWVKPSSLQGSFAQLASNWNSSVGFAFGFAFMGYVANTNVIFSWSNVAYWLTSPINLEIGKWEHLAITVEPTKVVIYHNGQPWVYDGDFTNFDVASTPFTLAGGHPTQGSNFNGEMDEVKFYKRALTQDEIREKMHLIHKNGEPDLAAYYQFNEVSGRALDRVGASHGAVVGPAPRIASTVPAAKGSSVRLSVTKSGQYDFAGTGVSLSFDSAKAAVPVFPNGELAAYRLDASPVGSPDAKKHFPDHYWIVRNWGANASFNTLKSLRFTDVQPIITTGTKAKDMFLYKRGSNGFEKADWDAALVFGAANVNAKASSVLFDDLQSTVTSFSQFTIGVDSIAFPVGVRDVPVPDDMMVLYPNPAGQELRLAFKGVVPGSEISVVLSDINGNNVKNVMLKPNERVLDISELARGTYMLTVRMGERVFTKKVVKEK